VDGKSRPRRIWNKISDKIETAIVNLALEEPALSPRELAVNFTDTKGSFVSEATVYRLLKDHGLITSPAFILMKAADCFANPTTATCRNGPSGEGGCNHPVKTAASLLRR
jgi:putative transposase